MEGKKHVLTVIYLLFIVVFVLILVFYDSSNLGSPSASDADIGLDKIIEDNCKFLQGSEKDLCYIKLAAQADEDSYCKNVEDHNDYYLCLSKPWELEGCGFKEIIGENVDDCYYGLSISSNNSELCGFISNVSLSKDCESLIDYGMSYEEYSLMLDEESYRNKTIEDLSVTVLLPGNRTYCEQESFNPKSVEEIDDSKELYCYLLFTLNNKKSFEFDYLSEYYLFKAILQNDVAVCSNIESADPVFSDLDYSSLCLGYLSQSDDNCKDLGSREKNVCESWVAGNSESCLHPICNMKVLDYGY